ncbi:MAG: LuxR family transcriptional regulator [Rhodospirillaceae bacterium]|nr:LuxR family transcriptional regulator [Rhodospirillaceae bacterium]
MRDDVVYGMPILAFQSEETGADLETLKSKSDKPTSLTDREVEILRWTIDGKTAWEVAKILKITERTVNFHLQNVMSKFGVHNKTHAAAKAMSFGLIATV